MKHAKKLKWMSVVSLTLVGIAACSPAAAGNRTPAEQHQVQNVAAASGPSSDGDVDRGPGCAESELADNTQD